jgi:hypothetical protein
LAKGANAYSTRTQLDVAFAMRRISGQRRKPCPRYD